MKTLKLTVIGIVLFIAGAAQAQVAVTVNVGSPPPWGPVGYTSVGYYYLPDVESYYDVQSSMFIYYDGGVWVHRANLPVRYRNYDLYGGYKVVMNDYHGNTPYTNFNDYKKKYAKGYHGQSQKTIGDRPGKANYKAKAPVKANSNMKAKPVNNQSAGHGNANKMQKGQGHGGGNMQKGQGHGGGNGKKK